MVLPENIRKKLIIEAEFLATRSSGPGGQNVNKVSTKVELRLSIPLSEALDDEEKQLILIKLKNRINQQGELIISSATERSQWRNREKAEKKIIDLIEQALTKPRKRKLTKPTTASKLRRLESKKINSQKKEWRKPLN
jgi:ribosome-associated protein